MLHEKLICSLRECVAEIPPSEALESKIESVRRKIQLIEPAIGFESAALFDPESFNLFESFDEEKLRFPEVFSDEQHLMHYIQGTPLFDEVFGSGADLVAPDGLFSDYIGLARERLALANKIRHGEITHRALFYEERAPQFTLLPLQDLLVRSLNALFDIDNDVMQDERAYLEKVESRCQSRLGDIAAYMHFAEYEACAISDGQEALEDVLPTGKASPDGVSGGVGNSEAALEKQRGFSRDVYHVSDFAIADNGICAEVIRRALRRFRDLNQLLDVIADEDVFGFAALRADPSEDVQPCALEQIEEKLIRGEEMVEQARCDVAKLQDASLEYEAQFRRECIGCAVKTVDFHFLNAAAHQKSGNTLEIAADLLIRTREAQLRLQLLEQINEVFWYISTAVFCTWSAEQPRLVHSATEFHCLLNNRQFLFADSEIEMERHFAAIRRADEEEFLFELERHCESMLAIKQVVEELFCLLCKSSSFHAEIIVLMCQIARTDAPCFARNAALFLQEASKYIALDERRLKLPNYSRAPVFEAFLDLLEQHNAFLQYDMRKEFVLASIFESARLELFYVHNFRQQANEPLNNIRSPRIEQRLFGLIGLMQAAEGALREIGAEMQPSDNTELPEALQQITQVEKEQFYTPLLCFREFGNARFLENFDCHEFVRGDGILETLALGVSRNALDDATEAQVIEFLNKMYRFLKAKLEYLMESNVTPFRELNIRAQRSIFGIIIQKYDYFSGQIDEIVSANLPITTSSIFLTQREKCNIPELLIDYVSLLAFCQFIWSEEEYYKERESMIEHYSIVEFPGYTEFAGLYSAEFARETFAFEHRNRLLGILVRYGRENAFEQLSELRLDKLFFSQGMHPPSPQQIATLPFDAFSDGLILVLMEWWQGIAFAAQFRKYLTCAHALVPYRPLVLRESPDFPVANIVAQDVEIICDQLQQALDEETKHAEALLYERLQMIKNDSELSTFAVSDFYDFLEDELGNLLTNKLDFTSETGLDPLCTALRYLRYLRHALFEEHVGNNVLRLTEMKKYGLFWFSGRQKLCISEIAGKRDGAGRMQKLIDEIEIIRTGGVEELPDQNAPIVLSENKTYEFDRLRANLCKNWLWFEGLREGSTHADNIELFRRYHLERQLSAETARYEHMTVEYKKEQYEAIAPVPTYSTPLPGITGVSDLESAQKLQDVFKDFTFMENYATRNFYTRLSRSCCADGMQHDYGLISNWAYAMLKRQLMRDIAHFVRHSRFYMRNPAAENDSGTSSSLELSTPSPEAAPLVRHCLAGLRTKEITAQRMVNMQRSSLEADSRSRAEQQLHRLQIRIWRLSWLSQAYRGQFQLEREELETLLERFYTEPIRALQTKLIVAEERLENFKDALSERARRFVAERRVSGLLAMGERVHSQLFEQIAAFDQELQKLENQLFDGQERLRKMRMLDEIQRLPVVGEITSLASLETAEGRRAATIGFYLKQIIKEKESIAQEQIAQLQSQLAKVCARAEEAEEMAAARTSKKCNFVEALATKIAVPQKLSFDIEQIQERCVERQARNQQLKMQIQNAKQDILQAAADTEKQAKQSKHELSQLKERKNALTQHIQALQSSKEMMATSIENEIKQSEQDNQQSIAQLGRKLEQERVKCRNAETQFKETRKIVDEFEQEALRRKNGLFI